MRLRMILIAFAVLVASAALAQTVTMGNEYVDSAGFATPPIGGRTYVDLVHPATANGTVTNAQFAYPMWALSCPEAVTIKFCRIEGNKLTVYARRGPFGQAGDDSDLKPRALLPPVAVQAGDLIGISDVLPNTCGGSIALSNVAGGEYLAFQDDVTTTVPLSDGKRANGTLGVSAWGEASDELTVGIVPVVGSTTGLYGSRWRTAVQLLNPHPVPAAGRLVFRSEYGTADDASVPYSLAPGATLSIPDIVATAGRTGRLGSLDVVAKYENCAPPILVTRVIHDLADGSSVGMIEESIVTNDCAEAKATDTIHILIAGTKAYLIAPPSRENSRFNIGIRTFASGATIQMIVRTDDGTPIHDVTRTYGAEDFELRCSEEFFGSCTGGESIEVRMLEGSAIVYGTTTDNVTNDPAIQFAHTW